MATPQPTIFGAVLAYFRRSSRNRPQVSTRSPESNLTPTSTPPERYQKIYPPWKPQSTLIVGNELEGLLQRYRVLLVHCGASWNRTDTAYDAILQELREEFGDQVGFYALDVDREENQPFHDQHRYMNIPALLLFVDGTKHEMIIGMLPKDNLAAKLHLLIAE